MDADGELREEGERLADAVLAALPGWSVRVVERVLAAGGVGSTPGWAERAEEAGREAAGALAPELRRLLAADVDAQGRNPMEIVRRAVGWPTRVLREAGAPPVARDDYSRTHFPDDVYGITPMAFGDIDPGLHEQGIRWGALKARAHLLRHRS